MIAWDDIRLVYATSCVHAASRYPRWFCAVLLAIAVLGLGAPASADKPKARDKAQAQILFDEGRDQLKAGKTAEACAAFAESQRLDPAIGTQLNLANCYEKLGKTASAWANYRDVETLARRAGQDVREKLARERAEALEPLLSKLRVEVKAPVPGLVVSRDGTPISDKMWGKPFPVDPGKALIRAEAPGKKPWTREMEIAGDGAEVSLEIPALADAPAEAISDDEAETSAQVVIGWVAIGTAVAGAAIGIGLRVAALGKDEDSLAFCRPEDAQQCTAEGAALRDDAQALQTGSVIAWAGGGALLVTGIVLLVTAPAAGGGEGGAEAVEWSLDAGPQQATASLRWRW
jgi:hypothetical protein